MPNAARRPNTVDKPIFIPVKLPGPNETMIPSIACNEIARERQKSINSWQKLFGARDGLVADPGTDLDVVFTNANASASDRGFDPENNSIAQSLVPRIFNFANATKSRANGNARRPITWA